jgi:hypothetical protein
MLLVAKAESGHKARLFNRARAPSISPFSVEGITPGPQTSFQFSVEASSERNNFSRFLPWRVPAQPSPVLMSISCATLQAWSGFAW